MNKILLSKQDVKQALQVAQLMSSHDQMVDVLYKELIEVMDFNKETQREKDIVKWIAEEKKDRAKEDAERKAYNDKLKAKEEAGEYVDINDWWMGSPHPIAITRSGLETVCGKCLGREHEPIPPEGCYSHYWKKVNPKKPRLKK